MNSFALFFSGSDSILDQLRKSSPSFSSYVVDKLSREKPDLECVWSHLVSEATHCYTSLMPINSIRSVEHYWAIGKAAYNKYPAIARVEGNTSWVSRVLFR